jgi:hypothetical protein
MKKWMLVPIVISLVLGLTACGSMKSTSDAATTVTALSQEGQLLVGTIKLESTALAVNADQAGDLLPLWETLQSLAVSSTAAAQEIDAVVSQIKSTMSAEQISGITAMNLTQQDLAAATADAGVSSTTASSTSTTNSSAAQLQTGAAAAGAGNAGGGNPPADMGGNMAAITGAQAAGQAQTGTAQAVTGPSTGTINQVSPALINALVELLKKKIG